MKNVLLRMIFNRKKETSHIGNLLEIITEDIDKPEASEKQRMQYDKALKAYGSSMDGVSWSQFEWKTYDTQMSVSVEDTVAVEDISIGETFIR